MDVECGICLGTMLPCQEVSQSECHPVSHFFHLECYNRWLQTQRIGQVRCPACRQFVIGEADWFDFAEIFEFDGEELATVASLPQHAQRYIRSWQCGTVKEAEKQGAVDAARLLRTLRAQHPAGQ